MVLFLSFRQKQNSSSFDNWKTKHKWMWNDERRLHFVQPRSGAGGNSATIFFRFLEVEKEIQVKQRGKLYFVMTILAPWPTSIENILSPGSYFYRRTSSMIMEEFSALPLPRLLQNGTFLVRLKCLYFLSQSVFSQKGRDGDLSLLCIFLFVFKWNRVLYFRL